MNDEQLVASSDDEVTCEELEDESGSNADDVSQSLDVSIFSTFFYYLTNLVKSKANVCFKLKYCW